jgi:hypothetical protein
VKLNFTFGKKKTSIKDYAIIGMVLFLLVGFLSNKFGISEKDVWKLIDVIQKELVERGLIDGKINDFIINTPELLDQRVERDVDSAIRAYERLEQREPPRMTNKTILKNLESPRFTDTQRIIVKDAIYYECPGGVMGIRGVWVDKDPNCN